LRVRFLWASKENEQNYPLALCLSLQESNKELTPLLFHFLAKTGEGKKGTKAASDPFRGSLRDHHEIS